MNNYCGLMFEYVGKIVGMLKKSSVLTIMTSPSNRVVRSNRRIIEEHRFSIEELKLHNSIYISLTWFKLFLFI